mgnify:FL=1
MTQLIKHPMKAAALLTLGASTVALATQFAVAQDLKASAANRLVIEDFIGSVVIREGATLGYELDMGKGLVPEPRVDVSGGVLMISGDDDLEIDSCRNNNGDLRIELDGGRMEPIRDYPRLTITMPKQTDADIHIAGGTLNMSDANSLRLTHSGCGDTEFSDVSGPLELSILGSGDIQGGSTGAALIAIRGSGDFELDNVNGPAEVAVMGSGDIDIGEVAGRTDLSIMGSGDVSIGTVGDELNLNIKGSGDVEIGGGEVRNLKIDVLGSGDVVFNGGADDVSVLLKGSGDVYVARSNGNRVVSRYGSGDVRIGSWRYNDDD